MMAFIKDDI
jgi:sphingomyelin phosphodiesterase